jgi:hypothetical protein
MGKGLNCTAQILDKEPQRLQQHQLATELGWQTTIEGPSRTAGLRPARLVREYSSGGDFRSASPDSQIEAPGEGSFRWLHFDLAKA